MGVRKSSPSWLFTAYRIHTVERAKISNPQHLEPTELT